MNILLLILKLFPLLIAAIQAIETSAGVAKQGPAKLALLKTAVTSAYHADTASKNAIGEDQLVSLIETITAQIVAFYNLIGIFRKSS